MSRLKRRKCKTRRRRSRSTGATIESQIGKIAKPQKVWIVPDMPKTRSGKIMRRVIAAIHAYGSG